MVFAEAMYKCDGCGKERKGYALGPFPTRLTDTSKARKGTIAFHNFCGFPCLEKWVKKTGFRKGVQAVIDYLKNEIETQGKHTVGKPEVKAHLDAVEKVVLETVVNALEEWQSTQIK